MAKLAQASRKGAVADASRYALIRWEWLTRFLDDGRVELDSDAVERSIRPLALDCKNALFAGSDDSSDHWAVIASLIETCKLAAGHSNLRRDQVIPWNFTPAVG